MTMHLALTPAAPLLPRLTPSVAAAAALYNAPGETVGQMDARLLAADLTGFLSGAAAMLGHKNTLADKEDLKMLSITLAGVLQRRFAGFKVGEVSEAIQRGACGEYRLKPDDVIAVGSASVVLWLESYQRTARALAVEASQAVLALPRAPVEVDYPAQVAAMVEQARDSYLPTGFDLDAGNVLYDYLKSIHAFLLPARPADYYADMRAQETDNVLAEGRTSRGAERTAYNTFLSALTQGHLPENHPLSRSVVNACKKRVLREWLLYHAAEGTDVLALLADFTARTAAHQQAA